MGCFKRSPVSTRRYRTSPIERRPPDKAQTFRLSLTQATELPQRLHALADAHLASPSATSALTSVSLDPIGDDALDFDQAYADDRANNIERKARTDAEVEAAPLMPPQPAVPLRP